MEPETRFCTSADGTRIAYEIVGSGTPVILLHFLYSNRKVWSHIGLTDVLSEQHTVVVIDSIGHGDSDSPPEPKRYAQAERAADVIAVMDQENLAEAHIVGYSMGAWIGGGVIAQYPDRVKSAALGGWDFYHGAQTYFGGVPESFEEPVRAAVAALKPHPPWSEWLDGHDEAALVRCFEVLFEPQRPLHDIGGALAPLLFYCGTNDPYHENLSQAADELETAQFLSIPGLAHVPAALSPEPVRKIVSFLASADE